MDMMSIAIAKTMVNSTVEEIKEQFGAPLVANAASGMTEQDRVYVYTGNETGFSSGHWYYYNGTAWTDGGVYNSVAVNTDTSLTVSGQAADSKAVGDALDGIDSEMSDVKETLNQDVGDLKADLSQVEEITQNNIIKFASINTVINGVTITSKGNGILHFSGTAN